MSALDTVVLVEGESDRVALHAQARRLGRDLALEGVQVLAMGGITNTRSLARRHGPLGAGRRLAGLYDSPDERRLRGGLAAAGLPGAATGALEALGFFGCSRDLEDELIRALGVDRVAAVVAAAGETASLERLARMPAQRDWSREAVLRRFLGSRSGRKARYARLLVEALEPAAAPPPLAALLAHLAPVA
ncbi:TOPRIM nucleotidyl transferase/hydrolase domain-containing protein [Agrococcus baldri]|uniref:OLD protein-like TOPRIM domain-containing protein n=1 Tax=Agrococcus baldri TaxID=153730 RepID=A0AA87URW1_9MICO|nr:TOPRIM nucleotidyl transferase/hydrolase domain-containing protein [Agrococcus baldri]GEK80308.1 hypothetical protein ABA31_16590 [Agrococcus baldri]